MVHNLKDDNAEFQNNEYANFLPFLKGINGKMQGCVGKWRLILENEMVLEQLKINIRKMKQF